MERLVILKLTGDVQRGFQASLEIGWEGQRPDTEIRGYLPPPTRLSECLHTWQTTYRGLGPARGIKPGSIELQGSLNSRKKTCQKQAKELDQALNEWLETERFTRIREKWVERVTAAGPVRVIIQSDDPQVQQFPWHRWRLLDNGQGVEVGFSHLEYDAAVKATAAFRRPVRILAILGNAEGINVERDRHLLKTLRGASVTFLVEPERSHLTDQLWDQQWDILFFAGHSKTEGETGRIYLNRSESLTLDELRSALKHSIRRGLQLAIFNSCDGLGLARELEQMQIPQLIVMRQPVPDRVAHSFLKEFLQALSQGMPFYIAVQQARQRLEGLEGDFPCASWLPVVWQNPGTVPFRFPAPVWNRLKRAIAISLMAAVAVIGLRSAGAWQPAELWAFDQLLRLRPDESSDPRLFVVEVTEADIRTYRHPLPGKTVMQLLQTLEAANPRAIGLDIFQDIPQEPGYSDLITFLQRSNRTIAVCQHEEADRSGVAPPPRIAPERVGFNDVVLDPDDVLRRQLLALEQLDQSACQTELAFSLRLALKYLAAEGIFYRETHDGFLQLGSVVFKPLDLPVGGYQQRVDLHGHQLFLNYRRHQGSANDIVQRASLTDVLNHHIPVEEMRDRIVLIGVTAASVKDDYHTPYAEDLRGLMIHAQMVSQILSAVLDQRSLLWAWAWWGDSLWIGGWATVGGLLAWRFSQRNLVLATGGSLLILTGTCFLLLLRGGWVPLVPGAIALLAGSISTAQMLHLKFRNS